MTLTLFFISILLALGIGMGGFSVTQLGYQDRGSFLQMFPKSIVAFLKGFFLWPYFLPKGLKTRKYQMKVSHKVGTEKFRP